MRGAAALVFGASLVLASCATRSPQTAPIAVPGWRYDVRAEAGAHTLAIEASFAPGSSDELSLEGGAEPYVRDVEAMVSGVWSKISPRGTSWYVPTCPREGCHIRYRFLLRDAVRSMSDMDRGMEVEGLYAAPPSTWLLHPLTTTTSDVVLDVTTPPGITFVSGLERVSGSPHRYRCSVEDLPITPYSAFGELRTRTMTVGGSVIDVAIAKGNFAADDDAIAEWVRASGAAVSGYFGRFSVPRAQVIVTPARSHGLFGKTLGNGGASILMVIGRETTIAELADDWVMPHEMIHLAFPSIPREQLWLEEGLSTYVEPIARLKAGVLDERRFWRELTRGLPHGLPGDDDAGLDHTHTWGRTYWGGALFCLLADISIREQTKGKHGLGDALRAILAAGGDARSRWETTRALDVGDAATGVTALRSLYTKMADEPSPVDLAALYAKLGVAVGPTDVTFDDSAPLAWIRRDITKKP